ncbi:MAG: hypothetical protein OSJ43_12500 [Oscillospiraceae bacterium]|nr:hypothetical protein [Oscillospiraceae bacterium]
MAEEFVVTSVCEERCRRLEEEDKRQNERIKVLETSVGEIHRLTISTEKLAASMEQMLVEQKEQGGRISKLEERDGKMWRKVVGYVITAVIGVALGFIFTHLGLQ